MTRPFFDEEVAWGYWVVSVGALLSFLGLVVACVCSCRRNENKNEFLGLAGMVTLNNSETDGFNRIPVSDAPQVVVQDVNDGGKRTSSANRSLPDIPKDKSREDESMVEPVPQDIYETTEAMEDHSELYATVQDAAQEQISERDAQEATQQSSLAQDISHQYTRFPSSISDNAEHPYAQVQNVQKTEASQVNRSNVNPIISIETPSTSTGQTRGNPVAPPRARRSSSHNSLLSSESHGDIQAANAISGGVQANQDLPYMTPPLLMLPHPPQQNSSQQHFSGDSQDSSKGYTSISVREPLANLIAQTKAAYRQNQSTRPITDPHYATVSDDSDEMYAAIDEQDKVYTSGSETYAQIQPTSETQRQAQREQIAFPQLVSRVEEQPAPQPPSVDSLRHVAQAHSRQASSSSATSSIVNPGSPKPEKRQANSPLPPPPEASTEGYASVDKSKGKPEERARSSLSVGKSLEELYAKVLKKKKEVEEQQQQHQQADAHPSIGNAPHPEARAYRKLSLIEISRASWCSHESVEIQKKEPDGAHHTAAAGAASYHGENEGSSTSKLPKPEGDASLPHPEIDHGYEVVSSGSGKKGGGGGGGSSSRGVASMSDPNYETVQSHGTRESEYPNDSTSTRSSADGYSVPFTYQVRQVSNASSEDPGYERVRLRRRVELDQDTDSEPNYESMPHEPSYATVCRAADSDTDPNYESVNHGDPNYESVRYMSVAQSEEPPYEQVMNNNPASDANATGYEKVEENKDTSSADYEKIDVDDTQERASNVRDDDTDDEQYVQV